MLDLLRGEPEPPPTCQPDGFCRRLAVLWVTSPDTDRRRKKLGPQTKWRGPVSNDFDHSPLDPVEGEPLRAATRLHRR